MKKTLLIIISAGIVLMLGYAYYGFNKTHSDMQKQKPVATLNASQLFEQFSQNESEANKNYTGKIIEVSGTIYSIEEGDQNDINILLMEDGEMFGVSCNAVKTENNSLLEKGDPIIIKGECSGFLSDVILIRCVTKND